MKGSRRIAAAIVLLAAYMLVYFHRTMTGVMKPEVDYYAKYYGMDPGFLLGVLSSAYFYAYGATQLFMGPFLDRYGVKRANLVMFTLLGIGTLLMALPSPVALVAGRAIVGATATTAFLSYMRFSALEFDIEMQAKLASLALFVGCVSTIIATYPLRLLLNTTGLALTLVLLAVVALTIAVLAYTLSTDRGSSRELSLKQQLLVMARIARNSHSWGCGLVALTTYGVGTAYQAAWGQMHLSSTYGMDKYTVSMYLMLIAIAFAVSTLPTGYLSDRLKRRKPFAVAAAVVSAIAWILMYQSTLRANLALLEASLVLVGVSQGLQIVAPTMAKEAYSAEVSGTAVAFFNSILFIGIALLQLTLSMLNPLHSVIISLAIALLGIPIAVLMLRETLQHK